MASIVYAMETLQVFRENSVVTVTINQPEKKNSSLWSGGKLSVRWGKQSPPEQKQIPPCGVGENSL